MRYGVTDILWGQVVKLRASNRCERCGRLYPDGKRLQAAHIVTRARKLTRWKPENGVALCGGDHMAFHRSPEKFFVWLESNRPGARERLLIQSQLKRKD